MSTVETLPIQLTEGAVKEVKHLLKEKNLSDAHGLRLGVKGGGCSGFSYLLDFDQAKDSDNVYTIGEVRVIIDKSQEMYLLGTILDFSQGLENRGFVFNNPNAESTCGCGSSFSA
ncbi:MAG TPA: iron-sulfur cluster assembly accessory protein [Chitinophagales bacterium]|nr:iron-sulfur cluster assembly accessory protein [Chitinophagales bacterium]